MLTVWASFICQRNESLSVFVGSTWRPIILFLCGGKSQSSDVWSLSTLFCCYEFADDFVSQCLSNSQCNLSVEKSYSESNHRRHPLKYTSNTWVTPMCVNIWCTVLPCMACMGVIHPIELLSNRELLSWISSTFQNATIIVELRLPLLCGQFTSFTFS